MQCDVCQRPASSKLPFNCTLCARDILYQPRLQHAQLLLEKESIENEVEQSVNGSARSPKPSPSANPAKHDISPAWIVRQASAEQKACEEQTATIQSHIQILREGTIQVMKADIVARRKALQQKRSELASAQKELAHARETALEPLKKSIRRTTHRWDVLHGKTAEGRLFLCREAAELYNLQHHRRKKGTKGRDLYTIGGIPITDLRDLNTASPTSLTVSLNHIAHLVHLTAHYLSLKLPAELTLPHRDYPRPTIFSPTSSYTTPHPLPYPGTTPSHSPSASRHKDPKPHPPPTPTSTTALHPSRPPPRARILHLAHPLPTLASTDQQAHDSFVEATTFLAWNIAWLCRTQGLPTGATAWDDLCAMGRNLHQLLLPPPDTSSPTASATDTKTATAAAKATATATATARATAAGTATATPPPPPAPGTYSHATTHTPLAAAAGSTYMRAWRLASPVKAVERVKGMLLAERTGAEWEILEGGEVEGLGVGEGEGAEVRSLEEEMEGEGEGEGERKGEGERERERGAVGGGGAGSGGEGRGWMKVKSRAGSSGAGV